MPSRDGVCLHRRGSVELNKGMKWRGFGTSKDFSLASPAWAGLKSVTYQRLKYNNEQMKVIRLFFF